MTNVEHNLRLRPGTIDDANQVGKIIYEAFSGIADKHGFPREFPSIDIGINVATLFLSNSGFYSIVAEDTGRSGNKIVGSNFLDERSALVAGVGPITIDPHSQNKGEGRQLMVNVMERARSKNYPAIRLLQASYHNRSLALYASLGFEVREPISTMQGKPIQAVIPGRTVRVANESDLESCNAVCRAVHGHDRNGELKDSIKQGIAKVVIHDDKITGYTSGLTYFNHTVGFTNDDIKALIASETTTDSYGGPGILIPTRNAELFRWCLENDLRLVHQLTLMTVGVYNEPAGSYMPSILY
ncbi:GNAT family N-acetyltransferase [Candidatus Nitrosocosmicus franklandus]|uniref:Acetyltransferase (GNAT) family protein n=1 Tax=Candidatus Nitrosocosmicus franklandianus TaxID=1798806 RepID=A0A484ICJ8_9ARCH|nr:GNAT family N-acetyltransferase [Candidatus Nitrosocosmicus franklandus]VFJ13939.1 Acetyltransferase (GNAT) family protein [Candidatus Nitrosocosmicus franklandus]